MAYVSAFEGCCISGRESVCESVAPAGWRVGWIEELNAFEQGDAEPTGDGVGLARSAEPSPVDQGYGEFVHFGLQFELELRDRSIIGCSEGQ